MGLSSLRIPGGLLIELMENPYAEFWHTGFFGIKKHPA